MTAVKSVSISFIPYGLATNDLRIDAFDAGDATFLYGADAGRRLMGVDARG